MAISTWLYPSEVLSRLTRHQWSLVKVTQVERKLSGPCGYALYTSKRKLTQFLVANFAAYTFAPPILITPLGALSVIIGCVPLHGAADYL